MRSLLFTASAGAIGFVLQQQTGKPLGWHLVPRVLFTAAAVTVFLSWDVQKKKARRRFEALYHTGAFTDPPGSWRKLHY
jgi:hypothetical protein